MKLLFVFLLLLTGSFAHGQKTIKFRLKDPYGLIVGKIYAIHDSLIVGKMGESGIFAVDRVAKGDVIQFIEKKQPTPDENGQSSPVAKIVYGTNTVSGSETMNAEVVVPVTYVAMAVDWSSFGRMADLKRRQEKTDWEARIQNLDMPAEYPGRGMALLKFLRDNMHYPDEAFENGISGKCFISMIVETDGKLTDIQVTRKVPDCPACDKEIIRVLSMMPAFIPGKIGSKPVRSKFSLPIIFDPR